MQRKTLILVGASLAFLLATSCSKPVVGKREDRPFAGVTLKVACPDADARQIVEVYGKFWESRTGGRVETVAIDARASADVWVLAAGELPQPAAAGKLLPLPAALTADRGRFGWPGLLDHYRYYLLGWGDTSYAAPLQGEALVCFYRKDRFTDPEDQAAYRARFGRELRPPRTWDEFVDIAEFLSALSTPPKASLPPLPTDERELERLFFSVSAPYARRGIRLDVPAPADVTDNDRSSFHFDLTAGPSEGQPRIARKGFVHALTLLLRMQLAAPDGRAEEPWRAFLKGDAVLCIADCHVLRELQAKDSPVRDRIGVTAVPGSSLYHDYKSDEKQTLAGNRVPYLGARGYLLAVPQSAANPDAAFDLLADLAGFATSMQIVLEPRWGGGATRIAHLDRERWDAFQLPADATRALGDVLRQTHLHQVANPVLCLRHPWQRDFSADLAAELRKALRDAEQGEKRAVQALETVDAAWKKRIAQNPQDHLRFYRTGLRR